MSVSPAGGRVGTRSYLFSRFMCFSRVLIVFLFWWGLALVYTLCSVLCALCSVLCTLYSILYTLYSMLCTLYSMLYTLYPLLVFSLYSILYTLYSVLSPSLSLSLPLSLPLSLSLSLSPSLSLSLSLYNGYCTRLGGTGRQTCLNQFSQGRHFLRGRGIFLIS